MSERSVPASERPAADELAALRRELAVVHGRLDTVTRRPPRRRLARFLPLALAALLVALVPLATLAAGPFTDLNGGSPHNGNIQVIADAGITKGCNPPDFTQYCPNGNVTREEMASFLARTAGLGGNPPVANAKTAQTADLATNATNAGNANTVGGYAPSGLVRVGRGTNTVALNNTFKDVATLTITAPSAGFVLVNGSTLTFSRTGCPCEVTMQLSKSTAPALNSFFYVARSETNAGYGTVSNTYVFPVAAGVNTFSVQARLSTGTTSSADSTITALFVPFGSTGAGTLEVPDAPGGGGAPGSGNTTP